MKFRYKLAIGMIIVLCLSFGIGGMLLIKYSFDNSLDMATSNCMQNFAGIKNTLGIVSENIESNYNTTFRETLSELQQQKIDTCVYVKLVDVNENYVVYSSDYSIDYAKSVDVSDESVVTYSWKAKDNYYYQISSNLSIKAADESVEIKKYLLSIVYDVSSVYGFRNNELGIYQKVLVAIILVGILLTFVFAIWITRPIEQLSRVVRRIADGDIESRARVKSGDEIEGLAENINLMADTIQNDMMELKESVEKQERFMGSFAHEMKTPMTSIIGYSDLMRSHDLTMDEMKESANYIFKEGKRLEALSLKMLDLILVNNEEINMTVTNPADMIKETVERLKFVLKKNNITLKADCEKAKIMADRDLFQSLLNNIIDNAAKAIDGKGSISVIGRKHKEDYIIQVKDNGMGMSESEIQKITEAFYRVDKSRSREQGGAGLGLAICKKIAEVHNARIEYKSVVGEGTEVIIIIRQWDI